MLNKTEKILQELYLRYRVQLESYAWEWEEERWSELVFCLLWHIGRVSDVEARTTVGILKELKLLDVSNLSSLLQEGNDIDMSQPQIVFMAEVLRRSGFSKNGIAKGLRALIQVANSLEKNHNGKIQHYLRSYGERMVTDIPKHFMLSESSELNVDFAFRVWMQNVLNMPIPAWDDKVKRFCLEFGISETELLLGADKLNMNVAVLDDLIVRYMEEQAEEKLVVLEEEQKL
jgi:hypothetical protein